MYWKLPFVWTTSQVRSSLLRAWYEHYQSAVTRNGFSSSAHDSTLFASHASSEQIILLVFVDDMIITGPETSDGSQVFLVNLGLVGILTPFRNYSLFDNYYEFCCW